MATVTVYRGRDTRDPAQARLFEDYLYDLRDALWNRNLRPSERKRLVKVLRDTCTEGLVAERAREFTPLFIWLAATGRVPRDFRWRFTR